jgi:hypothetical protein
MPHALTDLRHMPVHVGDHSVGSVTELILDPVEDTVLGFVVRAVTERSYFMPLALTHFREGGIWLSSPLHLVDDVDQVPAPRAQPGVASCGPTSGRARRGSDSAAGAAGRLAWNRPAVSALTPV